MVAGSHRRVSLFVPRVESATAGTEDRETMSQAMMSEDCLSGQTVS